MNKIVTISAIAGTVAGFAAAMTLIFGELPTIALSTDIEDIEIRVAANEAFMLDEAIDILQERIWANIDRQQTYLDKEAPIPANLREQLQGLRDEKEKLKRRRDNLP